MSGWVIYSGRKQRGARQKSNRNEHWHERASGASRCWRHVFLSSKRSCLRTKKTSSYVWGVLEKIPLTFCYFHYCFYSLFIICISNTQIKVSSTMKFLLDLVYCLNWSNFEIVWHHEESIMWLLVVFNMITAFLFQSTYCTHLNHVTATWVSLNVTQCEAGLKNNE